MKVGVPVYLEMSDGIKVKWNVHAVILITPRRMVSTVPTKNTFASSVKDGSMTKQVLYFIIHIRH
jgi:hypothetical protein